MTRGKQGGKKREGGTESRRGIVERRSKREEIRAGERKKGYKTRER